MKANNTNSKSSTPKRTPSRRRFILVPTYRQAPLRSALRSTYQPRRQQRLQQPTLREESILTRIVTVPTSNNNRRPSLSKYPKESANLIVDDYDTDAEDSYSDDTVQCKVLTDNEGIHQPRRDSRVSTEVHPMHSSLHLNLLEDENEDIEDVVDELSNFFI